MRAPILFAVLTLGIPLVACSRSESRSIGVTPPATTGGDRTGGVNRATVTERKPLSATKFGAAIPAGPSTPLPAILREPGRFTDQTVRTEGVVTAVCQAKGCWMQIADETGQAHIKFAGYSFFVPREASGHRAVVQGKVVASEDHCASKDGCRAEGEKTAGAVAKVDFEATGVEFVD